MRINFKLLGASLLAGTLISAAANAQVVGNGTFNLSGTVVGATGGVDFYYSTPGDQQSATVLPSLGVFSTLTAGTLQTIQDLTTANGVTPGTAFDFTNWIQLTDGINLDATSIPIPSFSVCPTSGTVAVGTSCLVNAASPIVLTQGAAGVAARLSVYGVAHYAGDTTDLTPFVGLLTSPSTNFATIAAFESYFDTNGMIPAVSYSGEFTTTTTTTPEPAAFWMASVGLLGFGLLRRKKTSA